MHTPLLTSSSFPFLSRHVVVGGYRIHYIDEGEGAPVLFLHGNATSSYVWRNVIPGVAVRTGRRCLAMDMLGFGKSDKPNIRYSLMRHADIVTGFIHNLRLKDIVLVGEDWGGPLGAYYASRAPANVVGMALMETFLWPMNWKDDFSPKFRTAFRAMRGPLGFVFIQLMNLMLKRLIPQHCPLSPEAMNYYLGCVPTVRSRRAMREFPRLLPVDGRPRESVAFFQTLLAGLMQSTFPLIWLKATPGVVPTDDYPRSLIAFEEFRKMIPRLVVRDFGPGHHFLAEENPERVVELLVGWLNGVAFPISAGQVPVSH